MTGAPVDGARRPSPLARVLRVPAEIPLGVVLLLVGALVAFSVPDFRAQEWSLWVIYGLLALSFTFVWGVPNSNANNPIAMDISMGNINFSPVPEVNPAAASAAACGIAVAHRHAESRDAESGFDRAL